MTDLDYLKYDLTETAQQFFSDFFRTNTVYTEAPSSGTILVLGDSDGSIARMILLAIQSNHIKLDQTGFDKLILLLEYEALMMTSLSYPSVSSYQRNTGIAELLADLINKHITYHPSETKLIFIGDILHDRLSCNKTAAIDFIVQLHQVGALFILGNHDIYRESHTPEGKCLGGDGQFGEYAVDKGGKTWDEWQEFEQKYFVHCYYDDKKKCFFIHNGILYHSANEGCRIWCSYDDIGKIPVYHYDIGIFSERQNPQQRTLWFVNEQGDCKEFELNAWPELKALIDAPGPGEGVWYRYAEEKIKPFLDANKTVARSKGLYIRSFGYYKTAFGDIEANHIEELCKKINAMIYKPMKGYFTDFRPRDSAMRENNGLFSENSITIIHGHNDFSNYDDEKVININARKNRKFSSSAIRLR